MTDPKIIDRIKKCFALSASPEPGEAAAALAKAKELMDLYGIKQKDIDMSRVEQRYRKTERNSPSTWETMLSNVIGGAFGCKTIYDLQYINGAPRLCINFIGIEPNAEIAAYAYEILRRKMKAARDVYSKRLKRYKRYSKIKALHSYSIGWVVAVFSQIQKLIPESPVPAIVEDYFGEKYPDVSSKEISVDNTLNKHLIHGNIDGRQVELNKGMRTPDTTDLLLN